MKNPAMVPMVLAVVAISGTVTADHVSEIQCGPALSLQWRNVQRTGVTDRRNRLKEPYRVQRSQTKASTVRIQTLDPGSVLFGRSKLTITLSNSSAEPLPVEIGLEIEGGASVIGPAVRQVRLAKRSPEPYQGQATFPYRVKERREPIRFTVRVLDEEDKELASASRGAIQPYYARLYADTCRIWRGEEKLGFRIKYQLAPEELARTRTRLSLSRDGKRLWKEALPRATDRNLRGKIDVSGLEPGEYVLSARVKLGLRTVETSRQRIKVKASVQVARERVALVVGTPPGRPEGGQVVSGGAPFPDGVLIDASRVRVVDENGQEVPSQADPTQFWGPSRRFIRWILLSFRAQPGKRYFLEYGSEVSRTRGQELVRATTDASGAVTAVKLDIGVLRLDLNRDLKLRAEARLGGQWRPWAEGRLGLRMKILSRDGLEVLLTKARDPKGVKLLMLPRTGWRFKLDPEDAGTKERWFAPELNDKDWADIETETFWEKQGYQYDGAAWYRTQITVPEAVVGQKLLLHFGAIDEWGHIYVNGVDCGGNEHLDRNKAWVTPFAVDVSKAVRAGQNLLAVRADDSAGAGGIWKPVELRLVNPSQEALKRLAREDPASGEFRAQSARMAIEENGPQRAVVRLDGKYRRDDREVNAFRVRLIARRGEPYLQAEHTFVFDQDPTQYLIGGVALDWPALGDQLAIPGPGGPLTARKGAEIQTISCDQYRLTTDAKTRTVDGRPLGWVDVASQQTGALVMLRDLWQQWPGAVSASPNQARVSFWPTGRHLDLSNAQDNFPGSDARGLAKTQRVLILAHAPKARDLSIWARRLDAPLTLVADPRWTNMTDVVGPMRPHDPETYAGEEEGLENLQRGMEQQQDHYEWYGLMDYGDFWHRWDREKKEWMTTYRRCVNNETTYDPNMYYVWQLFLRSGDPKHFRFMEARQMHLIDVDTCHSDYQMPERVPGRYPDRDQHLPGIQHRHDYQHWNGGLCHHHTTIEDPLLFYYLTGNRRGLDMAEELRRTTLRRELAELGSSSHRDFSMVGRFAFELYTHFGDPALLDYALDTWETMRLYQGPGGRAVYCYRRYAAQLEDERFMREYLITDVVDESRPQSPLTDLCKGKVEAYLFLGDEVGAEKALYCVREQCYFGVVRAPLTQYGDASERSPVGYGWWAQGAGKFLQLMELPVRAGIGTKPEGAVRATDKGGNWSDRAAWEGGRMPGPEFDVSIPKGSVVLYDGPAAERRICRSIIVEGRLAFASGAHTLVPHGNVEVRNGGSIEMGPGSTLLFDCKWSGDFGMTVKEGGALKVKGTPVAALSRAQDSGAREEPPAARRPQPQLDCRISALREDGEHNGYILLEQGSTVSFENAEIAYLGAGQFRKFNMRWEDMCRQGIGFVNEISSVTIEGCEVHHCVNGVVISKPPVRPAAKESRIVNNVFHHCTVGLMTGFWTENLRLSSNTFRSNGTGIDLRARAYKKAWLTGNQFIGNDIGMEVRWLGGSLTDISGNTYQDNGIGISLMYGNQEVAFREETINGGRVGIRIEKEGASKSKTVRAVFENCRIGVDRPNTEADILAETPHATITLKACVLGGPKKIVGEAGTVKLTPADKSGTAE